MTKLLVLLGESGLRSLRSSSLEKHLVGEERTTAAGLARRFGIDHLAGVESATAEILTRAYRMLPVARRAPLGATVTMDLDSTDVEVYGSREQGVAYNYAGQRAGRPHLATRAEAGVTTAAELLAGNDDVRPRAAGMLRRGLAGIPEEVRVRRDQSGRVPRVRADAGYFTGDLAHAAVAEECDFAIAAKRNPAMWRAFASVGEDEWVDAIGMPGAQVAAVDFAPAGWPPDTYTIIRRVRVDADAISADPRSRRRRTVDPASSPWRWTGPRRTPRRSPSSLPTSPPTTRQTTARPSRTWRPGSVAVPTSRTGSATKLLCVPARLVRHGRRLTRRLPPGDHLLPTVLSRIRVLDMAT